MAKVSKNVKRRQVIRNRNVAQSNRRKASTSPFVELSSTSISDAFYGACAMGDAKLARQMVMQGASVKTNDFYALMMAAAYGVESDIAKVVRPFMSDQDTKDFGLADAMFRRDVETAKAMINEGANVNRWIGAMLIYASGTGKAEFVRLLLESGADLHLADNESLASAVKHDHRACIDVLVDHIAPDEIQMSVADLSWEIRDPVEKQGFEYLVAKVNAVKDSRMIEESTPKVASNRARRL